MKIIQVKFYKLIKLLILIMFIISFASACENSTPQRWERMVYLDEFKQPTDEYCLQQKTSVEMNESITKLDEKIKAEVTVNKDNITISLIFNNEKEQMLINTMSILGESDCNITILKPDGQKVKCIGRKSGSKIVIRGDTNYKTFVDSLFLGGIVKVHIAYSSLSYLMELKADDFLDMFTKTFLDK